MPQLWLVPADESSYQRTLAEPVDLTDAPNKPPDFPDEARVWGVRTDPEQGDWERNRRNLERMSPGDPLLIYRNSRSRYIAAGRVGGRSDTPNTSAMSSGTAAPQSTSITSRISTGSI